MVNPDNFNSLYEFGGLTVFEVKIFKHVLWKEEVVCRTFNEEHAEQLAKMYIENGTNATILTYIVSFNNW
jgi:hypothetical protein